MIYCLTRFKLSLTTSEGEIRVWQLPIPRHPNLNQGGGPRSTPAGSNVQRRSLIRTAIDRGLLPRRTGVPAFAFDARKKDADCMSQSSISTRDPFRSDAHRTATQQDPDTAPVRSSNGSSAENSFARAQGPETSVIGVPAAASPATVWVPPHSTITILRTGNNANFSAKVTVLCRDRRPRDLPL